MYVDLRFVMKCTEVQVQWCCKGAEVLRCRGAGVGAGAGEGESAAGVGAAVMVAVAPGVQMCRGAGVGVRCRCRCRCRGAEEVQGCRGAEGQRYSGSEMQICWR